MNIMEMLYAWIQTQFVRKGSKYGEIYCKGFWLMQSDCVDVLMDDAGVLVPKGSLYYRYSDPEDRERPIHSGKTVYCILRPGIPGTALWENQYVIS